MPKTIVPPMPIPIAALATFEQRAHADSSAGRVGSPTGDDQDPEEGHPGDQAKALSTCSASTQSSKLTPFSPTKSTSFLLGLHWDGGKNHLGGGIVVWPGTGLSALAGAADRIAGPSAPASSWSVVSSMPQDLYGAAGVSNGTYAYAAGGYSASTSTTLDTFYRYNPVNERWETLLPPMPAAVAMASAVFYPTTNKIYVFGGEDPNTGAVSNATRVFDIDRNTWSSAANLPAPRAFDGVRLQQREREDLPGRRLQHGTIPRALRATTWEYNPATNTFTDARADPERGRRCRLGGHRRPSLRRGRPRRLRRRSI